MSGVQFLAPDSGGGGGLYLHFASNREGDPATRPAPEHKIGEFPTLILAGYMRSHAPGSPSLGMEAKDIARGRGKQFGSELYSH